MSYKTIIYECSSVDNTKMNQNTQIVSPSLSRQKQKTKYGHRAFVWFLGALKTFNKITYQFILHYLCTLRYSNAKLQKEIRQGSAEDNCEMGPIVSQEVIFSDICQ